MNTFQNLARYEHYRQDQCTTSPVILDCTLRDGGYYNNWCFDEMLVLDLVTALTDAGVDIIELGFKTPADALDHDRFHGLYRYCLESRLGFLEQFEQTSFAFMINTAEFLDGDTLDRQAMQHCIRPAGGSLFEWARIATHARTFHQATIQACWLKEHGYKVALNLMGISLLDQESIAAMIQRMPADAVDVCYFADSFGNLSPADIGEYMALIREDFPGKIGLHAHDNQGLAFANTLAAIEHNIDFVDATVTGMGRGAGNLRTEQLLLSRSAENPLLKPAALLDVIDRQLAPMQREHGWGWDYSYMLGALNNIHPTYCQHLRSNDQFTTEQVSTILDTITDESRVSYNHDALLAAVDNAVNHTDDTSCPDIGLPLYQPAQAEQCLIIAPGSSSDTYSQEIQAYIQEHQPFVIECNPKNTRFAAIADHYIGCILNQVKLADYLRLNTDVLVPVVTGVAAIPDELTREHLYYFPCRVSADRPAVSRDGLTLPDWIAGSFAVGIACLSHPSNICLAGFDGHIADTCTEQTHMQAFWDVVQQDLAIPLASLTRTTYQLPTHSIYGYLQ